MQVKEMQMTVDADGREQIEHLHRAVILPCFAVAWMLYG